MDKTLHKKLTARSLYAQASSLAHLHEEDILDTVRHEMTLMREAAKELLQPRPEAIAYLLKMSRAM